MSEQVIEHRPQAKPAAPANEPVEKLTIQQGPRWAVIGIFCILTGGAFYLAASFILPVVIAVLFALVLSPVVRFLRRRLKIWEPISAGVLVVGALFVLVVGFYMVSDPITRLVNDAPTYMAAVNRQVSAIKEKFAGFEVAQGRAEDAAEPAATAPRPDKPQEVVVQSPGLLDNAATYLPEVLASIGFALVFLFFLLASGDLFYQKLVKVMPTLSDKKRALHIAHDIERELSRYLFTITLINLGLGVAIGALMWWAGLPSPIIFGALAMLLNYIPYLGPLAGIALVGIIGLAEFGNLGEAIVPMLLYLGCTTVEGQLLTPMIVGRRLEMNAAAIFLAVAFWGWIWGVVGMFLAVPLMVGIKVFASYVEPLHGLADFLSVEKPAGEGDEE